MKKEKKYFVWYTTDAYETYPIKGPHYVDDVKAVGGAAYYHSLNDLMKMNLTDSFKKKLSNAKPGKKFTMHSLHANGSLYLKCVTVKQLSYVKSLEELHNQMGVLLTILEGFGDVRGQLIKKIL